MDEGDIPQEVPASEDYAKDPENVLRGHKATISNPQTSDEAKSKARKVLESYDEPYDESTASHGADTKEKDPGNVARGLKAAISNPGVSESAKREAKKKLDAM